MVDFAGQRVRRRDQKRVGGMSTRQHIGEAQPLPSR